MKVVDIATLGAGPWLATRLADFGADVVKVEHPGRAIRCGCSAGSTTTCRSGGRSTRGTSAASPPTSSSRRVRRSSGGSSATPTSSSRTSGPERSSAGASATRTLSSENPGLIMVRVTGWGQDGPYADRPGFGTLAEAISGWAHLNGFPENPPTLPPMGLGGRGHLRPRRVRHDGGALQPGRARRGGAGRRSGDLRVAVLADRPAGDPLRPARGRPAAHRQHASRSSRRATSTARRTGATSRSRPARRRSSSGSPRAIDRPELIDDPRFADNTDEARAPGRARRDHRRLDAREDAAGDRSTSSSAMRRRSRRSTTSRRSSRTRTSRPGARSSRSRTTQLGPTRTADVFPRLSRHAGGRAAPRAAARDADTDEVLRGARLHACMRSNSFRSMRSRPGKEWEMARESKPPDVDGANDYVAMFTPERWSSTPGASAS